jgi:outer membrane protein assembly complex protein YaeT
MMVGLRRVSLLALVAWASVAWGRVELTPKTYKDWQHFNGALCRVIEFPGIHAFSRSELLAIMATEKPAWLRRYVPMGRRTVFNAEVFASDLYRVEHFYHREGFPDIVVTGYVLPIKGSSDLRLKVELQEGPPMVLQSWQITSGNAGGVDSARWAPRLAIKTGKRLAQSDLIASVDTLTYKVETNGYARAHTEYRIDADSAAHAASVAFTVNPGDYCALGTTRIRGLKTVSEQTVRRELAYREGNAYSPDKLELTRENIVGMQLFTLVTVRADTSVAGNILPVYVDTQESRRYRIGANAGYDTQSGQRAQIEFTDLNFFGRGRRFTSINTVALLNRSTEIRLFWPHTPWNVTDVTFAPKWNYDLSIRDVHVDTRTNTTILSAKPLRMVTVALSNEIGSERVRVVRTGPDSTSSNFKSVETFSIGWDTRDNPLLPRRGHFLGSTFSESGLFYGVRQRWWRMRFDASGIHPVNRFTALAARGEYGIMGPLYRSPLTPLQERFRYGGPMNVRGWGLNNLSPRDATGTSQGGNAAFYGTVELRRNIYGPVVLAGFLDVGNVWSDYADIQPFDLLPSLGAGLLLITPVGPMRVDFAYQLRGNPYGLKRYAFDFSVGTPF